MIHNGTNIIQLGTGDVNVVSGKINVAEDVAFVSFTQCEAGEIGRDLTGEANRDKDGRMRDFDAHTRLIFINKESVDVLINHLEQCKEYIDGKEIS